MAAIIPTERLATAWRRGRLLKLASRAIMSIAVVIAATARLSAHDPGLSSLDVWIEARIVAVLSLASGDARMVGSNEALSLLAREAIELTLDGRRVPLSYTSVWSDESGTVRVRLTYERPSGSHLVVRSAVAARLARGHRELLSIHSHDGNVVSERMLDGGLNEAAVDISALRGAPGPSFTRFFRLGIEHILTGYDHLLFLAGLLVVLRRWADVIQTVTAFTVAHSITLALATTGFLVIPGRTVEPLIAASIVFVGVENLVRPLTVSRWKLTFAFGLVHGLGFATVLRDLGVGASGSEAIAIPVASFNLGVEAGQMAVASLLVPLFWWLSARSVSGVRFAVAWSVLVITAGSYWFVERIV